KTGELMYVPMEGEVLTSGTTKRRSDEGTEAQNRETAKRRSGEDAGAGNPRLATRNSNSAQGTQGSTLGSEVIAPRVQMLVRVAGDARSGKYVNNLVFRGLAFAHENWVTPVEGNNYSQAEANLSGAISMEAARQCALEGCEIRGVGEY